MIKTGLVKRVDIFGDLIEAEFGGGEKTELRAIERMKEQAMPALIPNLGNANIIPT